jgi:tetratricopeptide (TPR) repeat protein
VVQVCNLFVYRLQTGATIFQGRIQTRGCLAFSPIKDILFRAEKTREEDMKPMNKKSLWKVFAIMLAMALSWAGGAGADDAAIIEQADQLADDEKYEEANKLLMELAETNPDHPDVYWKISQNFYDMGERVDIEQDKDKKLDLYVKAEQWARKGYDKNPGLADNAFWMAVGMSQQAQTKGIASTLISDRTLAGRIEEFYIKSTQAKDFHYREENSNTISSAHFALGQFYRKVPSGWYIKMLMGTAGDMDKSVEHEEVAQQGPRAARGWHH